MDTNELISKLNWFYTLELNQVDWYNAQSKSFKGRYSGLVLERVSSIEQQHVDRIGTKIKVLGGNPTVLGDILSPLIGHVAGELISLTGLEDTMTVNILLEQKAMKDYNDLIKKLHQDNHQDKELIKMLQDNFIEEHLHTEWFRTKILAMKQYEFSVKHFGAIAQIHHENKEVDDILDGHFRGKHKRAKIVKPHPVATNSQPARENRTLH